MDEGQRELRLLVHHLDWLSVILKDKKHCHECISSTWNWCWVYIEVYRSVSEQPQFVAKLLEEKKWSFKSLACKKIMLKIVVVSLRLVELLEKYKQQWECDFNSSGEERTTATATPLLLDFQLFAGKLIIIAWKAEIYISLVLELDLLSLSHKMVKRHFMQFQDFVSQVEA